MTVGEIIADIKADMVPFAVTDQTESVKKILWAKKVFFLDTCFITKSFHIPDINMIFKAFELLADGKETEKIVFVLTDLVIYELKDSSANVLQKNNRDFLVDMQGYGFTIVTLNEERIKDVIDTYISRNNEDWNREFVSWLRNSIALLTYLGNAIKEASSFPYHNILDEGFPVPKDESFIRETIASIKNEKHSKDSLAEELLCISFFFLFEVACLSGKSEYCFCSADLSAISRLRKAVEAHPKKLTTNAIQIFTLLKYMIDKKIMTDKAEVVTTLKKISGGCIHAVIYKGSPYSSEYVELTPEDTAEIMFAGENITFTGKVYK